MHLTCKQSIIKFISFILLVTAISTPAQSTSLSGRVTDSKNGNAVQGAVVFISYNYLTYTNNNGYYILSIIPKGKYEVKVSRLGYKPLVTEIKVDSSNIYKNFILEPSPIELDEIIVNTGRIENYLKNSPYSELLVGKKEIEKKPFQSLSDALKEEPGISILRDGTWGTEISIRGLNRENVVALIDGNRIATSTDIAARFSLINLNDIERIEIIKGASSSIYGSGATGGIVNVITKQLHMYDNFSVNGYLTSGFNSVNNLSSWSGSLYSGDTFWSAKFSGSYRKAQNTKTPAGELKNSQFEDYSLSGALNVIPIRNNLLKLNYQLFKANNVGIPGGSVFPGNAEVRYPDEKRELLSAGYEIQNITKTFYKLSANYSYQFIKRNVENIPHIVQNIPASGTTLPRRVSVLKITPGADHKSNNLGLQGYFMLNDKNNFTAGLDYWDRSYNGHREKYQLIEVLNLQGNTVSSINKIIEEKPLPNSTYKSIGVFIQDDARLITNKLTATLGARVDRITVKGETTLNPVYEITDGKINYAPANQKVIWNNIEANDISYSGNIGLKYSATSNLDFTLSLGSSFRSPSLEERFQYIDQGSFVRVGDPNLKPEKGNSADLGIRYYSSRLKIVSSIFFNYFRDLVTELPGIFEGRNAYIKTNIGRARMYGFDFHTDYNFYSSFIFYTSVSYVKGDDITSNGDLPEIPPLNGSLGFKFNLFENLSADLSMISFAAQNKVATGEIKTPGYTYFNVNINASHLKLSAVNFNVSVGIENIFNRAYRNHLSTTRGFLTYEPGRNFYIKLITEL